MVCMLHIAHAEVIRISEIHYTPKCGALPLNPTQYAARDAFSIRMLHLLQDLDWAIPPDWQPSDTLQTVNHPHHVQSCEQFLQETEYFLRQWVAKNQAVNDLAVRQQENLVLLGHIIRLWQQMYQRNFTRQKYFGAKKVFPVIIEQHLSKQSPVYPILTRYFEFY